MRIQKILITITLVVLTAIAGNTQTWKSKTFSYYKDYIITKKDTIFCNIDSQSLGDAKIRYTIAASPDKIRSIKRESIIEMKSRFVYKNIEINGRKELLKVLIEGPVSLYSREKKGKTRITDKDPEEINPSVQIPSRSTFYISKNGKITELTSANFKTILKQTFEGDEKLMNRVGDLKYEDLEFTLLNMVIGYNFRINKNE